MKKIVGLVLFSSLLIGCSDTSSNEDNVSESEKSSAEVIKSDFEFTSGVNIQNLSYADVENFTNIEGISHGGKTIYVIYNGTVVDNIEPESDDMFIYYNKSENEQTRLVFSNDENLKLGDSGIKTSDLTNSKAVNVIPNEEYLAKIYEDSIEETESEPIESQIVESEAVESEIVESEVESEVSAESEYMSETNTDNTNESEPSSGINVDGKYQAILDEYTQKLKSATPKLVEEYNAEYPNNQNGLEGLAKLSNDKVSKLAEISNDGVGEMADIYFNNGSGEYEVYEGWAGKLMDVYMIEAQQITDAYMDSAQ